MKLKAIIFNLSGVIINDEDINSKLTRNLLIDENIIATQQEYKKFCLGRGDRGIADLLQERGRLVTETYLQKLIEQKNQAYQEYVKTLESIPIYKDIEQVLSEIKLRGLQIGLVSGAPNSQAKFILEHLQLIKYFDVIVGEDEVEKAKPDPQSYLVATAKFQNISPEQCLAIEDTPVGIEAAKRAGIQVVGVAHTYPFHFMQRYSNWAVDYLVDIEWEWIEQTFASK